MGSLVGQLLADARDTVKRDERTMTANHAIDPSDSGPKYYWLEVSDRLALFVPIKPSNCRFRLIVALDGGIFAVNKGWIYVKAARAGKSVFTAITPPSAIAVTLAALREARQPA